MNKRVTDSLERLAGSVMNVAMNAKIVKEVWPRAEVARMVATPALEATSLCLPS